MNSKMHRSAWRRAATLASLATIACVVGCQQQGQGVRGLSKFQSDYYSTLKTQLQATQKGLADAHNINVQEAEDSVRVAHGLELKIRSSKAIYGVYEVLKAPDGDRAVFIQDTRNKLIAYTMADMVQTEEQAIQADMAAITKEEKAIQAQEAQLVNLVQQAIDGEKVIYTYLNQSPAENAKDVLDEVGRQVTAFNEDIKKADQNNSVVKQLGAVGTATQQRISQIEQGLGKSADTWRQLNAAK